MTGHPRETRASNAPARFDVEARSGAYPVWVGQGLLERAGARIAEAAPAHRYAVVADAVVAHLYGGTLVRSMGAAGLEAALVTFPEGEASKSREQWARITDALLEAGLGRDGGVVALGGGVTGDLAGFVAATFMRGVPLVQVPTSLLAMVDASIGGKTAVDVPAGKNLVGAFHAPRAVVTDPAVAATQTRAARAEGLVEAVKHGAIRDADYLETVEASLEAALDGSPDALEAVVAGSVAIKAEVVSSDEHESGLRHVLNFGHTLGHGLEAASGFGMSHGQAVALGMVLEARLGQALGVTRAGTAERLTGLAARLDMPTRVPAGLGVDQILGFVDRDKKAREGHVRYVLLEAPAQVSPGANWVHAAPRDAVAAVLVDAGAGA